MSKTNKVSTNVGKNNKNTSVNDNINEIDLRENKISQKVDSSGKTPSARFGHTLTMVSSSKIVMFGGAVGDTKNFVFSNETYSLNLNTKIWNKLECKSH